ncbi:hypothetical protein HCN44_004019 [Aphidius gifuensis]|uniref:Venom protein n=1 Tax=Aphidius gifuensis TaxID=684658 RepID=A0A835CSP8_APHGI|nr:uncharacterized protein LOC122848267 [Aphidius gifuensis]KAF7994547.1 hypothetical protein HCN44_004019 [Aphidius gifuensis]
MANVNIRIFLILLLTIIGCVNMTNSATIRSDEFGELLERMTAYDNNLSDKIRYQKRAIQSGGENVAPNYCLNQPCGWAVYIPSTRQIESFITNVCTCPDSTYECIRTDDDLSVSAYVYRCRQNTTADDIKAPKDAS